MLYGTLSGDPPSAVSDQTNPAPMSRRPKRSVRGDDAAYSPTATGSPMISPSVSARPRRSPGAAEDATMSTAAAQIAAATTPVAARSTVPGTRTPRTDRLLTARETMTVGTVSRLTTVKERLHRGRQASLPRGPPAPLLGAPQ